MIRIRIIVAGSRDFCNYDVMNDILTKYLETTNKELEPNLDQVEIEFVSGTARGADTYGEQFAQKMGYPIKRFPADWNTYGKKAGYVRNNEMAQYSITDESHGVLFAFWDGQSKGTKHMINLAKSNGVEVRVILGKRDHLIAGEPIKLSEMAKKTQEEPKIYTTYFAKTKFLTEDVVPIAICAKLPRGYNGLQYKKLAPKYETLTNYKNDGDWERYDEEYTRTILDQLNPDAVINDLRKLSQGKDIALVCYEKDQKECHRGLVAEWLKQSGYSCSEYGSEADYYSSLQQKTR